MGGAALVWCPVVWVRVRGLTGFCCWFGCPGWCLAVRLVFWLSGWCFWLSGLLFWLSGLSWQPLVVSWQPLGGFLAAVGGFLASWLPGLGLGSGGFAGQRIRCHSGCGFVRQPKRRFVLK